MVREGVDTLKINPSGDEFIPHARAHHTVMTEEEIAAVCDVGHAHGKRIAAHARSAESVKLSLKHGAAVIYHATQEAASPGNSAPMWALFLCAFKTSSVFFCAMTVRWVNGWFPTQGAYSRSSRKLIARPAWNAFQ